jgi:hypothetical protein
LLATSTSTDTVHLLGGGPWLILTLQLEKSNVGAKEETKTTEGGGLAWREEEEDMGGMETRK